METNPQLELAFNFLEYTGTSIFLTGKAGTGKTTFLRELKRRSPKRMIVVAPTGVAAINAGGVTIHSFFQLPFGPYVPGRTEENRSGEKQFSHKFGREKINIIRSMDLLVIDEISMVRADLLDAVSDMLCRYRDRSKPVRWGTVVDDRRFAAIGSCRERRGMGDIEAYLSVSFLFLQQSIADGLISVYRIDSRISAVGFGIHPFTQ